VESSLYILIPLSIVLVFAIGLVFWWSVKSGQYEDLDGPAYRLLFDDEDAPDAGEADRRSGASRDASPPLN